MIIVALPKSNKTQIKHQSKHFKHQSKPLEISLGRVLTLVETDNESNRVYGLAYKLKSTNLKETFAKLNLREKCGYSLRKVSFHSHNESRSSAREPITCVCYFANSDNYYYSPHLDDNLLAMQIFKTAGPSGTNKEYLYNFCRKLNELFDEKEEILKYDSHIFQLEKLVRNLEITAE